MENNKTISEDKPKITIAHCKKCNDKLFKIKVTETVSLDGKIPDSKGELVEYKQWYSLKDMFDFDSITFSKIVDGNTRFLSCGTCESGALGFSIEDKKKYYISVEHVDEK